jgi:uncharacterized membrane protein YeaQ/YmgE (transglycosylase-associated protein family)
MLAFVIILLVIGLIAGLVARLLLPGRDNIGILGTIAIGVVGSFVGGFLWELVEYHTVETHAFKSAGLVGSIVGAFVVLLLMRVTGLERGHRRRRY